MANSDETGLRRRGIFSRADICQASAINLTPQWYLENSRYPVRDGNKLTPFFSGEEIFGAIAHSIKNARHSLDIVLWGFDPAMPIVRTHETYGKKYVEVRRGHAYTLEEAQQPLQPDVRTDRAGQVIYYCGWREEDSYGHYLLDALRSHPDLKIRIVVWQYLTNQYFVEANVVGIAGTAMRLAEIERSELKTGFSPEEYDPVNKNLNNLPLRRRHPLASRYSSEWFHQVRWEDFPGKDRIAVTFRDIPDKLGRILGEEDERHGLESGALSFPTDHQKTLLVDFEDDANRHGYVMGHNSMTEYWSEFPFAHRSLKREMDCRPYHDFSLRVEGPLTIDLNENFCEAWGINRVSLLTRNDIPYRLTQEEMENLDDNRSLPAPPVRALEKEKAADLQRTRRALYPGIEGQGKGACMGQIARTRPDQMLHGHCEREIKDAYLQAVRFARDYLLIVNQYCQYAKLIRHLKYWRKQGIDCGLEGNLYILMGTCRPENPGMVFRAHQMANELGLSEQFTVAEDVMYDRDSEDESGHKDRTRQGIKLDASEKVPLSELDALGIKPLFFMLYTQAPQGELAQQVYVHAKLMLEDDIFFTLGSANLNMRSMAADSELNILSDDLQVTQTCRKRLLEIYTAKAESNKFPNHAGNLTQEELAKIYKIFKEIAASNLQKVKDRLTIQGHAVMFEDKRDVSAIRVT